MRDDIPFAPNRCHPCRRVRPTRRARRARRADYDAALEENRRLKAELAEGEAERARDDAEAIAVEEEAEALLAQVKQLNDKQVRQG